MTEPKAPKAPKAAPQAQASTDVDVVLGAHAAIENLSACLELLQAEQPSAATFVLGDYRVTMNGPKLMGLTAR